MRPAAERLYRVVKAKYEQNRNAREKLIKTDAREIIYDTSGNHDNLLGRCRCKACRDKEYKNLYGKALMCVRSEFQEQDGKT